MCTLRAQALRILNLTSLENHLPRRINDGLHEFRKWLVATNRTSPGTAKNYMTCVRKVIREVGTDPDETAVDTYFRDAAVHESSYSNLRAGWITYVEWRAEEGATIPEPPNLKSGRKRGPKKTTCSLPEAVREALLFLKQEKLPLANLTRQTWGDVVLPDGVGLLQADTVDIAVPDEPGTFWRVSAGPVRELWAYAQVPEGQRLVTPLIPREPGSLHPYPYRALLKELSLAQDSSNDSFLYGSKTTKETQPKWAPAVKAEEETVTSESYESGYLKTPKEGTTLADILGVSTIKGL